MARLYGLVSAVFAVLVSGLRCHAETLQLRFNWAPIFCYAGSNNGVPKEFCGQGPDGTYRFQRHRLSLLKPFDSAGCSNTSAYDPTALNAEVRQHLACTNPSCVWNAAAPSVAGPDYLAVTDSRTHAFVPPVRQVHPRQR